MSNKIILFFILLAVVVLASKYHETSVASFTSFPVNFASENATLTTETGNLVIEDQKTYETANGMVISVFTFRNDENATQILKNSILFRGRTINTEILMQPGSSWSYAELDGFLIVPRNPAVFNLSDTSYYPKTEKLVVKFEESMVKDLDIYFSTPKAPTIVNANADINWNFDRDKKILKINSEGENIDNLILYFVSFNPQGTVFIEDMSEIEKTEVSLKKIEQQKFTFENAIKDFEENIGSTRTQLETLRVSIQSAEEIIRSSNPQLEELRNRTKSLENRVSANVLLSPSIIVIGIMVTLVLVVLWIDMFLFKPKGEINAKK